MKLNSQLCALSLLVIACLEFSTSYHGDSSEGTDSSGGKTEAKRAGACK